MTKGQRGKKVAWQALFVVWRFCVSVIIPIGILAARVCGDGLSG